MVKILSALLFATFAAAQNTANLTEYLLSQSDLSSLVQALSLVPQLASALPSEGITILAPVNSAFEAIATNSTPSASAIAGLLSYHVLNGTYMSTDFESSPTFVHTLFTGANVTGGQNVGLIRSGESYQILSGNAASSEVTEADIKVGNITIHKIGSVLDIPQNVSTLAVRSGLYAAAAALTSANLIETVDTVQDLTLFAPIDSAFESIASVLAAVNETVLQSVLLYHAVTGSVLFSSDAGNVTVPSAAGANITLSVINGTIFVNSAKVIIPNIITSNGVIHVIDTVLNPEEEVNRDDLNPSATESAAFPGASSGSVPLASPTGTVTPITIPAVYTTAPAVPTGSASDSAAPTPTDAPNAAASLHGKSIYGTLGAGFAIAIYLLL